MMIEVSKVLERESFQECDGGYRFGGGALLEPARGKGARFRFGCLMMQRKELGNRRKRRC